MSATNASSSQQGRSRNPTISQSLKEYGRGIAGGLLFSLPLLFTQEVWEYGFLFDPFRMLIYVFVTFLLLLGYNRYAGLRHDRDALEVVIDSFEEMGIGLVIAAVVLLFLGRLEFDSGLTEMMGLITLEGMTVAIGVSVGTAQLGTREQQEESEKGTDGSENADIHLHEQIVLAVIGAVLIAGNVGPTQELTIIGMEAETWQLVGLMIMSLAICATILFYSDFVRSHRISGVDVHNWYGVLLRTATFYIVALASSALVLWAFARFDGVSLDVALAQTVALGLIASLGSSAGRLLLQ